MKTNVGKYHSLEELLIAIKCNIPSYSDLTIENLRELNLKKDKNGFFHKSDFIFSCVEKVRPKLKVYPISHPDSQNDILDTEFPILKLDPIKLLERSAQIEAYNFSLLFFSEKFNNFINKTRIDFDMPVNGFNSYSLRWKWLEKTAYSLHKLGYLKKSNNVALIYDMIKSFITKFLAQNSSYKRKNPNLQFLFSQIFFDYLTLNDPFFSISKTHTKTQKSSDFYQYKIPAQFPDDNLEIHIGVYKDTTKDEVKRIIDRSWKTIKRYQKSFTITPIIQRIKDIEKLKLKIKVYHSHKIGYPSNQIASIVRVGGTTNIRKIISDMKKEILKAEQTETL